MRSLLAAAVLLALLPASAEASLKSIWGPNELPDGRSAFPTYERLGVDVLQRQLRWDRVATARPADARNPDDPAYAWPAELDEAAEQAPRHGIRLALMVKGAPSWSNGGRGHNVAPRDPEDYADFVVAASRRYPGVRHWMIWGEPSQAFNWWPQGPEAPRAYAVLLDRAYVALKLESRRNVVIGGMTFTVALDTSPVQFVRRLRLPNGRPPRLDWFGHNPFTTRYPRLSKDPYHPGLRDISDIDTYIRQIRRVYRRIGRTPKLWLSEFTVPSDRGGAGFRFHVSRRTQARWLKAAFRIADRARYVAGIGWFNLVDEPGRDGLRTGLLTSSGKRKPAYQAYRRAR